MADLEQLSVTLSARIDDFKRGMQEAVREFDRDAGQIDQRNQQLAQFLCMRFSSLFLPSSRLIKR
jgi:hypothetical protein